MVAVAGGGPAEPYSRDPVLGLPELTSVLTQAGRENFPVASRLLPGRLRSDLLALYGYARLVDDVGDDTSDSVEVRLVKLALIESDLDRIYTGAPELPALRALAPTVHACGVPRGPLARLIEANRRDQYTTRYATFADLVEYCSYSADPVGELVLAVVGRATPERLALSNQVCTALQVLEHCQDVGEDFRRGRVYLPQADLAACGVADSDLTASRASPALRAAVRRQVHRASRLLDQGSPLVATLPGTARLAVAGYLAGGRATAAALESAGFDVLGTAVRPRRARLLAEWVRLAAGGGDR